MRVDCTPDLGVRAFDGFLNVPASTAAREGLASELEEWLKCRDMWLAHGYSVPWKR